MSEGHFTIPKSGTSTKHLVNESEKENKRTAVFHVDYLLLKPSNLNQVKQVPVEPAHFQSMNHFQGRSEGHDQCQRVSDYHHFAAQLHSDSNQIRFDESHSNQVDPVQNFSVDASQPVLALHIRPAQSLSQDHHPKDTLTNERVVSNENNHPYFGREQFDGYRAHQLNDACDKVAEQPSAPPKPFETEADEKPFLNSAGQIDTSELCAYIVFYLKVHGITQQEFGAKVLSRQQGTTSALLMKPKPWTKLDDSRETYERMLHWAQIDDQAKQSIKLMKKEAYCQHIGLNVAPEITRKIGSVGSRTVFTREQKILMEFECRRWNGYLSQDQVRELAERVGLDPKQVRVFIANSRKRNNRD